MNGERAFQNLLKYNSFLAHGLRYLHTLKNLMKREVRRTTMEIHNLLSRNSVAIHWKLAPGSLHMKSALAEI